MVVFTISEDRQREIDRDGRVGEGGGVKGRGQTD